MATRKRLLVVTDLDEPIVQLVLTKNHKALALWAAECAERVLHYFEDAHPNDLRPRQAIEALHEWLRTGVFHMADVRGASLAAHAAAREAGNYAARAAARAAGQAIATAHVKTHASGPARYAATAIYEGTGSEEAMLRERAWQYERLLALPDAA